MVCSSKKDSRVFWSFLCTAILGSHSISPNAYPCLSTTTQNLHRYKEATNEIHTWNDLRVVWNQTAGVMTNYENLEILLSGRGSTANREQFVHIREQLRSIERYEDFGEIMNKGVQDRVEEKEQRNLPTFWIRFPEEVFETYQQHHQNSRTRLSEVRSGTNSDMMAPTCVVALTCSWGKQGYGVSSPT